MAKAYNVMSIRFLEEDYAQVVWLAGELGEPIAGLVRRLLREAVFTERERQNRLARYLAGYKARGVEAR